MSTRTERREAAKAAKKARKKREKAARRESNASPIVESEKEAVPHIPEFKISDEDLEEFDDTHLVHISFFGEIVPWNGIESEQFDGNGVDRISYTERDESPKVLWSSDKRDWYGSDDYGGEIDDMDDLSCWQCGHDHPFSEEEGWMDVEDDYICPKCGFPAFNRSEGKVHKDPDDKSNLVYSTARNPEGGVFLFWFGEHIPMKDVISIHAGHNPGNYGYRKPYDGYRLKLRDGNKMKLRWSSENRDWYGHKDSLPDSSDGMYCEGCDHELSGYLDYPCDNCGLSPDRELDEEESTFRCHECGFNQEAEICGAMPFPVCLACGASGC